MLTATSEYGLSILRLMLKNDESIAESPLWLQTSHIGSTTEC